MTDNFDLRLFLAENKLTKNAKLLKEQDALGITPAAIAEESDEEEDFINPGNTPDQAKNRQEYIDTFGTGPVSEEGEMVQENPLPKYKNIDELMSNIEHGTNEAAHKYKMGRMKEIADALEAKVSSLEEGEIIVFVNITILPCLEAIDFKSLEIGVITSDQEIFFAQDPLTFFAGPFALLESYKPKIEEFTRALAAPFEKVEFLFPSIKIGRPSLVLTNIEA